MGFERRPCPKAERGGNPAGPLGTPDTGFWSAGRRRRGNIISAKNRQDHRIVNQPQPVPAAADGLLVPGGPMREGSQPGNRFPRFIGRKENPGAEGCIAARAVGQRKKSENGFLPFLSRVAAFPGLL